MALTVPITRLSDTTQATDIAASKGPRDIYFGRARIKEYVKLADLRDPMQNPRLLEFDQPYQVAAHYSGCSWEEGNLVFLEQIADCNLQCPECYAYNPNACIDYIDPEQYVADFVHCRLLREQDCLTPPGVMRISGGEPVLHQEWVAATLRVAAEYVRGLVLLDTNLTIKPEPDLVEEIQRGSLRRGVCVCGCLKPGLWDVDDQIETIRVLLDNDAQLFIYWRCDSLRGPALVDAMEKLEALRHGLPLRLTPIHIKWDYANVARGDAPRTTREQSQAVCDEMRRVWWNWCCAHYTVGELWAPSHLMATKEVG
jgi:hypothetical protein